MMKKKLWTKNYTYCFIGTIISALGGIGLNLALSAVVFNETNSTFLSGIFAAISLLPNFILPILVGPHIDRNHPLKILVKNEVILGISFFLFATIINVTGFQYWLYLLISVLIGVMGVISNLAYQSVIPFVMEKENYGRGNALLNTIYPLCKVLVTPLAMWLFLRFGVAVIFYAYGLCCLLDAFIESKISFVLPSGMKKTSSGLKEYLKDIQVGFQFVLKDKAVRSVYLFFVVMLFANNLSLLLYPYFVNSATLTVEHYSLLLSINSAGYMFGGFLHYFVDIPNKYKFSISIVIYLAFILLDGSFFFLSYPIMLLSKFLLGLAGMNSANIRVTALQHYIPHSMRAKSNALFSVMVSFAEIFGQLSIGFLGEFINYSWIAIGVNSLVFWGMIVFILPKKNQVKELYNNELAEKKI